MELISKQFDQLKKRVNKNGFYLDIGCSFVGKNLEGTFLLFEKHDASEIEMAPLLELIKEYTDVGILEDQLIAAITHIRDLFSVGWLQIFAIDVLNKNKVKFYFFEKKLPFLIGNDLDILKKNFDYGEVSYDPTFFKINFFALDLQLIYQKNTLLKTIRSITK